MEEKEKYRGYNQQSPYSQYPRERTGYGFPVFPGRSPQLSDAALRATQEPLRPLSDDEGLSTWAEMLAGLPPRHPHLAQFTTKSGRLGRDFSEINGEPTDGFVEFLMRLAAAYNAQSGKKSSPEYKADILGRTPYGQAQQGGFKF